MLTNLADVVDGGVAWRPRALPTLVRTAVIQSVDATAGKITVVVRARALACPDLGQRPSSSTADLAVPQPEEDLGQQVFGPATRVHVAPASLTRIGGRYGGAAVVTGNGFDRPNAPSSSLASLYGRGGPCRLPRSSGSEPSPAAQVTGVGEPGDLADLGHKNRGVTRPTPLRA